MHGARAVPISSAFFPPETLAVWAPVEWTLVADLQAVRLRNDCALLLPGLLAFIGSDAHLCRGVSEHSYNLCQKVCHEHCRTLITREKLTLRPNEMFFVLVTFPLVIDVLVANLRPEAPFLRDRW